MSEKVYVIPTVRPVLNDASVRGAAINLRDNGKPITASTIAAYLDTTDDVAGCQAVLDKLELTGGVRDVTKAAVAVKPVMQRVDEALAAKVK